MRRRDLGLVPLFSRREAVIAGLAALVACGPGGEEGDTAAGKDSGEAIEPATIDTIVVLMMENRSFDHYLGAMKLAEGAAVEGLSGQESNADADGNVYGVAPATIDCLPDPPHGWDSSHTQFGEGANDGFVRAYVDRQGGENAGEVMGYFTRAQLPVTWALADAYAVCDRYFCSVMGPTWPNRMYAHAGTSQGRTGNDFPEGGSFDWETVWTKLDAAGVAWKYYYTDVPFLGLFTNHLRDDTYAYLEDFVEDALEGELPPVVWVDPGFTFNDDHPPHHPALGQELIALVYEALAASPHWGRCLLLVTYDEHGGFFDHVPPPTTSDDHAAEGFDQLGFRVPSIAVGPFVKRGAVSDVLDHTSWLRLVCERFGLTPWTARIAAATSLAVVLDADRMAIDDPADPVTVPDWDIDDESVPDSCFDYAGPAVRLAQRLPPGLSRTDRAEDLVRWIRAKRKALRARS